VDRIIGRCLRKDAERRWQNIADIKVALEDALEELTSRNPASPQSAPSMRRRTIPLFAGCLLAVAALGAGVFLGSRSLASPQPAFQRMTFHRGNVAAAKFSPDRQTIFFTAQWGSDPAAIYSMRPGSRESRPLDLSGARILSMSSTGEMAILLGSSQEGAPGTLARVPIAGGAPREILENVIDADWSPDGATLAVSRTISENNRIEFPIGTILYSGAGLPPSSIRISPKGDRIAFFEFDNESGEYAVAVLDLSRNKRILSRGWDSPTHLSWTPSGNEIWFGGVKAAGESAIRAVSLDGEERTVAQTPAKIAIEDVPGEKGILLISVDSRTGIAALPPGATVERDLSWFDSSLLADISADGKTVLFTEKSDGRNPAVYLRKTDGSPAIRLGAGNQPVLSPDGKWAACIVNEGAKTVLTLLPTGPGEARSVGVPGMHYQSVEWFPDGYRLLVIGNQTGKSLRAFVQDSRGGAATPLTPEGTAAAAVSPDQQFVTVSDRSILKLFPVEGGAPREIAKLEPTERVVRWSGDGRFLFTSQTTGSASMNIYRLDVASGRREFMRHLQTADPVGVRIGRIMMTPDGAAYAYSFRRDLSTLYLGENLR
jgi:Tol biopolymer transport system component